MNTITPKELRYAKEYGYVYAIRFANGCVKVGKTKKPAQRLNTHRISLGMVSRICEQAVSPLHYGYSESEKMLIRMNGGCELSIKCADHESIMSYVRGIACADDEAVMESINEGKDYAEKHEDKVLALIKSLNTSGQHEKWQPKSQQERIYTMDLIQESLLDVQSIIARNIAKKINHGADYDGELSLLNRLSNAMSLLSLVRLDAQTGWSVLECDQAFIGAMTTIIEKTDDLRVIIRLFVDDEEQAEAISQLLAKAQYSFFRFTPSDDEE